MTLDCAMCAELRRQIARLEQQVDTLTDTLRETSIARTLPPTMPKAERTPDPIAEAIRLVSGTDAALRKHLFGFVKGERAKPEGGDGKLSESELLAQITHWPSPEDEGVPSLATA